MTDPTSLKVTCIFEACARLRYNSETACLAAYLYHRFFRYKEKEKFDIYALATTSIRLARRFFEKQVSDRDLIVTMFTIIHGPTIYLDDQLLVKLTQTINIAEKVVFNNLRGHLSFKDDHLITPGQLQERYRTQQIEEVANRSRQVINISDSEEESSDDDDDRPMLQSDSMLTKNSKHAISSHRYLLHYLKSIEHLLRTNCKVTTEYFSKISNMAWIFLCDYHWSSTVTQIYANQLACACLMMAIETYRTDLEKAKSEVKQELWRQLDRKWNLIFCDDFTTPLKDRTIDLIVFNYYEFDRLLQHELSLNVIDPAS